MKEKYRSILDKASIKPWFMMIKVMLAIIIVEVGIMMLFTIFPLPQLDKYELAFLDAFLLGVLVTPMLYLFLLLPLQRQTINEQKNRFLMYDSLTGLPRRNLFRKLVEHEISKAKRESYCAAMIVIGPSDLSRINQSFGYKIGDELLSQLAKRIQATLRESDIVARLSGNEFGVLLPDTDIKLVKNIIKKISEALEGVFKIDDIQVDIMSVMGISIFPDHADTASDLIRRANIARTRAKHEKLDYDIYDVQDESASHQRLLVFGQLRSAIKAKELELYYQPKVNLDNGEVAGVEALARWLGESGQSPAVFIPLAEQTGLINEITRWVFETAVDQCCEWRDKGLLVPVSINVSP